MKFRVVFPANIELEEAIKYYDHQLRRATKSIPTENESIDCFAVTIDGKMRLDVF